MNETETKIYNVVLHFAVFVFTGSLVWFSFVYYPRVVSEYRAGKIPDKPFVPTVLAASNRNKFPIETNKFRVVQEKSGNYYAFVKGDTLDEYVDNKHSAELMLKTSLSTDSLCHFNVIFASTTKLNVSGDLNRSTGC